MLRLDYPVEIYNRAGFHLEARPPSRKTAPRARIPGKETGTTSRGYVRGPALICLLFV